MATEKCDVAVVGAGISGLCCAKLLKQEGLQVIVLEARDRVGGRTLTKHDPSFGYCDVGGAFVGPTQNRILRVSKEHGVDIFKTFIQGQALQYRRNGSIVLFDGFFPTKWNFIAWLDMNHFMRSLDTMGAEIPADAPWSAPHAVEWDSITVQKWLDTTFWTQTCKDFATSFCHANLAIEPSEISLLWMLWYVKSCCGSYRIWETENGGQEFKFVGGSQQISIKMAEQLGGRIRLRHVVKSVKQSETAVWVETEDGHVIEASHVAMTVPFNTQNSINFEPSLSLARQQLMRRVPMGRCIKSTAVYQRSYWKEKGLSGFTNSDKLSEPVKATDDDSKPDGSFPALTIFVNGDGVQQLSPLSFEERKTRTCQSLARIYGIQELEEPAAYVENDWTQERFTGGCYTAAYPPGVMTRFGSEIRKPHGRIHFGGTETASHWSGYMEGAVQSGERVAREILFAEGKIEEHLISQTEPVSKDIPEKPFELSLAQRLAPSVGGLYKGVHSLVGIVGIAYWLHLHRYQIPLWIAAFRSTFSFRS